MIFCLIWNVEKPLHYAAREGHLEVCHLLIQKGAILNVFSQMNVHMNVIFICYAFCEHVISFIVNIFWANGVECEAKNYAFLYIA